jgi:uncharacterized protein YbbC (DUF1343 family)
LSKTFCGVVLRLLMKHWMIIIWCAFLCADLQAQAGNVVVGAERLDTYLPWLRNKEIGLVVNPSSLVGKTHLVDTLCALDLCVARIYAPEHGFRGQADAGEHIKDGQDARTSIPIVSLYGKKKKPRAEDLAGIDVLVFDIQDVGCRFFTYISTLFYVMEACAENDIPLIVLDRPNPNGHFVDGPVLDMRLESFVGIAPLPIVYGCTIGELARLFKGEGWIGNPDKLNLKVVPCSNYTHQTWYELPVRPSPNLPDMRSIMLYPSICLFEGSSVSVGRGTDTPFQVFGHPDNSVDSFAFTPRPNAAARMPPHQGWVCYGQDLRNYSMDSLRSQSQLNLHWLLDFYNRFPNKPVFFRTDGFFDLLAGTSYLRKQMEAGKTESEIRASWQEDLGFFKAIRKTYLLYPD